MSLIEFNDNNHASIFQFSPFPKLDSTDEERTCRPRSDSKRPVLSQIQINGECDTVGPAHFALCLSFITVCWNSYRVCLQSLTHILESQDGLDWLQTRVNCRLNPRHFTDSYRDVITDKLAAYKVEECWRR